MKEYKSAAFTMMGRRTRNQDNFLIDGTSLDAKHNYDCKSASGKLGNLSVFAVVDGNGTKDTGEAASRLVCETLAALQDSLEELNSLSEAGAIINKALCAVNEKTEAIVENSPNCKMGASCAILVLYNDRAYFGNVGDSAVYMRRDGRMQKLTTDHTEGEELIARGALTRDMLKNHSSKTKVTRMIGYLSFGQSDIMQFYDEMEIQDGDIFVLATQGIVQYMSPEEIDREMQSCVDPLKSAERVVKAAHGDFESKDNVTGMIVRIAEEANHVGGAKSGKVKPVRGNGGVRLHTEIDIDPKVVLRAVYIAVIVIILGLSAYYMYKAYPREQYIEHHNQNGAVWEEWNGQGKSSDKKDEPAPTDKDVKDSEG